MLAILRHLLVVTLGLGISGAGLAQPADLDPWKAVTSRHFTIYTDASAERGAELARSLELFRGTLARQAPALELRAPVPTKIFAFASARAYAPYKTRRATGGSAILGQFLSHRDGNYLTLDAGTQQVGAFAVIYHEYVHDLVKHNFHGVPLWFNEGLAEYYSTFAFDGETVRVGRPVARHLRWLERDPAMSLTEILEAGRDSPSYHGGEATGRFYAGSWALVHHLMSGGTARLERLVDHLDLLDEGAASVDAFEEAFDTRLDRLQVALRADIVAGAFPEAAFEVDDLGVSLAVSESVLPPATTLYHLGDLLAQMGRRGEAEAHFLLALDHDPHHPEAHAGLAHLRELGGRFEEAELLFRDALDLGSQDPHTHLRYGRHLLLRLQRGDLPDEGEAPVDLAAAARKAFEQVVGLDPAFAEGWAMLGVAHLFGSVDPTAGMAALRKALAALPGRQDLAVHLVRLHLAAGELDAAQGVVARWLAGVASDDEVARVREDIERARLLAAATAAFEAGEAARGLELFDQAVSMTRDPELQSRMEDELHRLQEVFGER